VIEDKERSRYHNSGDPDSEIDRLVPAGQSSVRGENAVAVDFEVSGPAFQQAFIVEPRREEGRHQGRGSVRERRVLVVTISIACLVS
jgi:hypothetical protein